MLISRATVVQAQPGRVGTIHCYSKPNVVKVCTSTRVNILCHAYTCIKLFSRESRTLAPQIVWLGVWTIELMGSDLIFRKLAHSASWTFYRRRPSSAVSHCKNPQWNFDRNPRTCRLYGSGIVQSHVSSMQTLRLSFLAWTTNLEETLSGPRIRV